MTILFGATLTPAIAGVGVRTNPPFNFKQRSQPARKEISRERAIEIARERRDFKPKSVRAVRMIEDNHKVWRVTIYGEPFGKLLPIGGTMMVSVDRLNGKILSFSKNYCIFRPESIFDSKQ